MIRLLEIAVFSLLVLWLPGCNRPKEDAPIWEGLKIGDLEPSQGGGHPGGQRLKTINFNVYIFEMPADKISVLADIWEILYIEPLRFADYDAFCGSSFSVGFGQSRMLNKVIELLEAGGGQKVRTVSLLLPDGQTNDVTAAMLHGRQNVFHIRSDGSIEGESIGPGRLALRIKAVKVPGLRGVCNVDAVPVFTPPMTSSIPQLAAHAKSGEFSFAFAGFGLKMSPGDFFFFGPKEYSYGRMTLAGYFFSRPAPSAGVRMFLVAPSGEAEKMQPYFGPVVRAYLILCTGMND